MDDATKAKDMAYWERNQLVAHLARVYESHMVRHPDSDTKWDDDWRWIVCIHTPEGQMTWHIKDSYKWDFDCIVEPDAEHWDGHTTEEKYARLKRLDKKLTNDFPLGNNRRAKSKPLRTEAKS